MNVASEKGVELKGGMYAFMSLRIDTTDLPRIDAMLADKVQQAPAFFKDTPVVLDLTPLTRHRDPDSDEDEAAARLDAEALLACIRRHHLVPLVASVGDKSSPLAASVALPLIEGRSRRDSVTDDTPRFSAEANTVANTAAGTARDSSGTPSAEELAMDLSGGAELDYVARTPMMIDRPVRSGQQLYARDTDLIIIGQVGPGAEVIADHNIHIYGPLRGRALCGVSGNTSTRIFCQSLEAELVSVAGNYRMLETIPADLRGKPAKIALDNDRLSIEPL